MKVLFIIAVCVLSSAMALAQQDPVDNTGDTSLNLAVGSSVPDFVIPRMIHNNNRVTRTGDFNDRLLLIDFWATGCSGCVESLPRMEALQKKFGDRVRILPVTYEPEVLVSAFWKKNKYIQHVQLPSVVADSLFETYFRHKGVPHEVWINKGKVIAITDVQYVDSNNIRQVLEGKDINWPVKNDFYVFDARKHPLFTPDENQVDPANTFIEYAAISDYKEGVNDVGLMGPAGIVRDTARKTVRAFLVNSSIYTAYFMLRKYLPGSKDLVKPSPAYMIGPNEIAWEVGDRSKYFFDYAKAYQAEWIRKNGICFESLNPDTGQVDQQVNETILKDLDHLLGLKVRWEKRNEKVWVLTGAGPTHAGLATTPVKNKGMSIQDILYNLNRQEANPYVFNESGYLGTIVLPSPVPSWTNIRGLQQILKANGLEFKEEQRLVDKLVFTEVDGGLLVDAPMQAEAKLRRKAQVDLKDPAPSENETFLQANKKKPGVVVLPSGLQYKVITMGKGARPSVKDKVRVNYTGTLVNGKIFDSSFDSGRPAEFGVSDVIAGWTEALQLMPVGSKWTLYIPAGLAYAGHTGQGAVPPNSALVFTLELLAVIP